MVINPNEMTTEQLQAFIDERVAQKLGEILGKADESLEVKEELIMKLKDQKASRKNILKPSDSKQRFF